MDETNHNTRPKHMKVFRATDVIPPFEENPAPAEAAEVDSERPAPADSEMGDGDGHARSDLDAEAGNTAATGPRAESSADAGAEIPKYDLAENILAEQRRVAAARRRRSPSPVEHEPPASPAPAGPKAPASELPSEDLPELQRIVAEIVARDIERLCRRPDR